MSKHRGLTAAALSVVSFFVMFTTHAAAQAARTPAPAIESYPPQISEKDVANLQDQLLKILRLSPTLAEVVARDPSLLSNAEYVNRTNPELGRFLQAHPEIGHNPDFYLFNNLHGENEQPSQTLERKLWPEMSAERSSQVELEIVSNGIPFLVFVCMLAALLWLTHVLLENRRWNRIFKLQTDVHSKLLERMGTSQEVLTYMDTDAGKRFLEAAPIAVGLDRQAPVPSPVARVLTPLQIGIVMTLLGLGLLFLRSSVHEGATALLLVGTIVLMPGLGLIISAGITWGLARHLGLMPESGVRS
jgi:hypothetical protein